MIGIPCKGPVFDGMDALLATVQMPTGIPVATVAVNGGANAALLAAEILAVEDAALAAKLDAKRKADAEKVLAKDALFMLINSYTTGLQPAVLNNMLSMTVARTRSGRIVADEIVLPVTEGGVLPCGASGRWQAE